MHFVLHCPEPHGPQAEMIDPADLVDIAVRAERAGFDAVSLSEHPVPSARWLEAGGHQTLDPLVALGYLAAATSTIQLLTNLIVAPYRNPSLLAKAAATLDRLSAGRLILGLGTGYLKSEFHALGVDFDERNTLFDETLDVLPLHWRGEPFSYDGMHFSASGVIARPRPVRDPIPIWIGGNSALTRRRVAAHAQGWLTMSGSAQLSATARTPTLGALPELARTISELRAAALERGRTEQIDVSYSYLDRSISTPAVDTDRHRAAFAELAAAGITWVVVSSGSNDPARTLDFIEAFGASYLTQRATVA